MKKRTVLWWAMNSDRDEQGKDFTEHSPALRTNEDVVPLLPHSFGLYISNTSDFYWFIS